MVESNAELSTRTETKEITERKKADKALQESEERYRLLFEQSPIAISITAPDGKFVDTNKAVQMIFGYSEEEFNKTNVADLYEKPEQRNALLEAIKQHGAVTDYSARLKHKDGTSFDALLNVSQVHILGRILFQTTVQDITERKRAELAVLESREKFESLFMRSPEAMAYIDPRFEILKINPRFTELFGYRREEAEGKNLDSLIVPPDKITEAEELDKRAIGGYIYHDTTRKTKHGSFVPVSVSAAPIVVQSTLTGYVAVYKDISHLKETEEALTIMNEKLRVISDLTRHDARNRLTLVTTNAYLAKECLRGNNEAENYLEKIEAAVNDVVGIFDFAKIYEMLGAEKPTYIDMEKAVNEAALLFPALKMIKVVNDCHGLAVLADSLLRQAFYNLIDDSLKYGQTFTQIKIYYERANNDNLKLIYEDNGVGIPLDKKPRLFQKGYTTGKGSGYGLYLIQKMMEIYGWTIQETGEPGKGAQFIMKIPKLNKEGKELYCLNAKA